MNKDLMDHKTEDLTLLYVEDEPLLRQEVATYLSRRVGKVHLAANGVEALKLWHQHKVDAVMTDLLMPEMDGMTLLREIRSINDEVPFVIATAINDFKTMQEAIQIGVVRFLIKPFETTQIDDALVVLKERASQKRSGVGLDAPSLKWSKAQLTRAESELAKLIKETTHKGPTRVTINVCANLTEIVVNGGYTKMEQTMLKNPENQRFVDYYRETFYQHIAPQLKSILNSQLCCHNQLVQIICSGKRQMDILKWISD